MAFEVNFDGLVGPTHHYAGLSFGNVASTYNKYHPSNPKQAALQGLAKMKALSDMGFQQGILPPQARPCLQTLRQLGFSGEAHAVLKQVMAQAPGLLSPVSSASAMWVANAATVSPSADTADQRVHLTVANLNNKFHRALEAATTQRALQAIFKDPNHFAHHAALPGHHLFGDEGAANHNRLCRTYGEPGVEVFVYGEHVLGKGRKPSRFPARQTREASEAVVRLHQLPEAQTVFLQQNPNVIDQGVFHNDVIAVSNGPVLFYHEEAFVDQARAFQEMTEKLAHLETQFIPIEVPSEQVTVADAVSTYLFNSQLLTKPDGTMMIVVPQEAKDHEGVWRYLSHLVSHDKMINEVQVFNLRESMRNGGGPACLRLRVVLTEEEMRAVNPNAFMTSELYTQLTQWVETHYRDRLTERDLADPQLLKETYTALDELTQLMDLGSIYSFQREV